MANKENPILNANDTTKQMQIHIKRTWKNDIPI